MRTHYLASGLITVTLLSAPAVGQTTQPSTNPTPVTRTEVPKLMSPHWRASKMIGLNVYNEQNEKLGDINEIIYGPDGNVLGYVIGVGGFLGIGEHDLLIEPSKIKFVNEPARTASTTSATTPPANTTAPTNTRNVSNTTGTTRAANEQWYPDHALVNATKDQLKTMPQFKYSSYN